jgi:hypothetical protein
VATDRLAGIERDCNLSEKLLRSMVIRADHVTPEQMEAAEGRAELADEIKLRGEQEAQSGPSAQISAGEAQEAGEEEAAEAAASESSR